jgi:copper resistance protein B
VICNRFGPLLAATLLAASAPAWAQTPMDHDRGHAGGGAGKMQGAPSTAAPPAGSTSVPSEGQAGPAGAGAMPGMQHGDTSGRKPAMQEMQHGDTSGRKPAMQEMQHGDTSGRKPAMQEMQQGEGGEDHGDMTGMQGGSAPPDARDPHAYSGGQTFGAIPRLRLGDEHNFASLLVDRLEYAQGRSNASMAYDVQAWFGRDYDRAVLKAEGEVDGGRIEDARTELLWGHAVASFWDLQLGLRYDSGDGPDRSWLAFGVQGLAPYWFEVDAAAYIGENGRSALRIESEYELLLTQKLILQPRIEANFYGKSDPAREIGNGLSTASMGLRLRYEIKREFAPYVGVQWVRKFGTTADFARAEDKPTRDTQWVAGLRIWF